MNTAKVDSPGRFIVSGSRLTEVPGHVKLGVLEGNRTEATIGGCLGGYSINASSGDPAQLAEAAAPAPTARVTLEV